VISTESRRATDDVTSGRRRGVSHLLPWTTRCTVLVHSRSSDEDFN